MRFAPSDEQDMLAEVSRDYLAAHPQPDWTTLVEEQAWHAIALPEAVGGMGFGLVELALVAEQVGRVLAPVPLLSNCALAATAIRDNATAAQAEAWLGRMAEGERFALVLRGQFRMEGSGDAARVVGEAPHVLDGASCDHFLVPVGGRLVVVPATAVHRDPLPTFDDSRPASSLRLDWALEDDRVLATADLTGAHRVGWVIQAAEAVGAAEFTLDQAVEYAKVRTQFGKAIGSFQAIKHKCADMLLQVESARSAAWYAAWALDAGAPDAHEAARTAATIAADALFHCAGQNIQIHGGIGFTWEHGAHRYLRRARADMQLLGHPRDHREALAKELLGAMQWT